MARSTASVDNQDIWADLLGLADRQAGELALLRGLLGVLCKSGELKGAAVYTEGGDCFQQKSKTFANWVSSIERSPVACSS
jgi:hypothetical protein